MEQVLELREIIIRVIKRYERPILFILRFLAGLFIFSLINDIGRVLPEVSAILPLDKAFMILLMMALLFTVLPTTLSYWLIIIYLGIQISAVLEAAVAVVVVLSLILIFYARLAPKENVFILVMFFAYYFKLPYLIPILAGMYFGITTIIPISVGVFAWSYVPVVKDLLKMESVGFNLTEMPKAYATLYSDILGILKTNTDWIVTSFIFAMILLVVYALSRISINYAKEIAIVIGGLMTLICLGIASALGSIEISFLGVLLSTIISMLIMGVIRFFDAVLDYKRAERVQFQDEEYIYYVKLIPKVIIKPDRNTNPDNEI